jgi:C-terminal processing protease CtpA/Prc
MIRRGFITGCILLSGLLSTFAQTNSAPLDFQDVYNLIRQHAAGVSEAELNRAAVAGLISELSPQVSLVTSESSSHPDSNTPAIAQQKVFDGDIAYLRIAHVNPGLAEAVTTAYQQLSGTNKVSGVVLDLRYTDGTDYPAAASTADLFVGISEPLLNWNGSAISSHEKSSAITVPVAVLVNHETSGASEALAAMLREIGSALILGGHTAGRAMLTQDYPLPNGDRLRIASAPITLGNGNRLSADGLRPDIDVTVSLEDERAYYADAFLVTEKTNSPAGSSNNVASETNESLERVPFNEAELVREHKAGENPDEDETPIKRLPEPKVPVVSDPALARALDLLKGLAVVRQSHS